MLNRKIRWTLPASATLAALLIAAPALAEEPKPKSGQPGQQTTRPGETKSDQYKPATGSQQGTQGSQEGSKPSISETETTIESSQGPAMTEQQLFNKLHHVHQAEIEMGRLGGERASSKKVKDFSKDLINDHQNADKKLTQLAKRMNITLTESMSGGEATGTTGRESTIGGKEPATPGTMGKEPGTTGTMGKDTTGTTQPKSGTMGTSGTMAGASDEHADHQRHMELMNQLRRLSGAEFDREFLTAMQVDHDKHILMITQALNTTQNRETKDMLRSLLPTLEKHRKRAVDLLKSEIKPAT